MIPEKLTWWSGAGESYEVWRTPQGEDRFAVLYYQGDVLINRHGRSTEIAARDTFEKLVEERG
jgi:hypothetical protein